MKEEHVSEGSVGQRRTENGNLVLGGPVVNGAFVVDLEAQPSDDLGRRPQGTLK